MSEEMTERQALETLYALAEPHVLTDGHKAALLAIAEMIRVRVEAEVRRAMPYTHRIDAMRYGRSHTEEEKSLEDAIAAASWAVVDGHFIPLSIRDMEGNILLEGEAMDKAMSAYQDKADD